MPEARTTRRTLLAALLAVVASPVDAGERGRDLWARHPAARLPWAERQTARQARVPRYRPLHFGTPGRVIVVPDNPVGFPRPPHVPRRRPYVHRRRLPVAQPKFVVIVR
jgi:hypothetical protein